MVYPIARDLRPVYTAPTEVAAAERFDEFAATWGERYPGIELLWRSAWAEFVPFLAFPVEVRRVIFSTNAVESLNAGFRRAARARGHFPTEQAALNYTVKGDSPQKGRNPRALDLQRYLGFLNVHLAQSFLNQETQAAISKAWKATAVQRHRQPVATSPKDRDPPRARQLQRRLTEDEISLLVRDYREGATQKELAAAFGVARTTVIRNLQQQGVTTRRTVRKLSKDQVGQAQLLYEAGQSLATIGHRFGVSMGAVRRELLRAGVELRPRSGR